MKSVADSSKTKIKYRMKLPDWLRVVLGGNKVKEGSMPRDFFNPPPEGQRIVLVDEAAVRQAQRRIESCEQCTSEGAEFPFDLLLDRLTGSDPKVTDYIVESPAKCPRCRRDILEKTLVEPA